MTTDDERSVIHSRRTVLASALAVVGGAVGMVLGREFTVRAADGAAPVVLGATNSSDSATRIVRSTSGPALIADGSGPGVGLSGTSEAGIAVYGVAQSGFGVLGSSATGSGVEAVSPGGIALRVRRGRVRADGISGIARIVEGASIVTMRPAALIAPDAFVLLTPMADLGGRDLWAVVKEETLDIHVSSPVDEDTRIGWFLLG